MSSMHVTHVDTWQKVRKQRLDALKKTARLSSWLFESNQPSLHRWAWQRQLLEEHCSPSVTLMDDNISFLVVWSVEGRGSWLVLDVVVRQSFWRAILGFFFHVAVTNKMFYCVRRTDLAPKARASVVRRGWRKISQILEIRILDSLKRQGRARNVMLYAVFSHCFLADCFSMFHCASETDPFDFKPLIGFCL